MIYGHIIELNHWKLRWLFPEKSHALMVSNVRWNYTHKLFKNFSQCDLFWMCIAWPGGCMENFQQMFLKWIEKHILPYNFYPDPQKISKFQSDTVSTNNNIHLNWCQKFSKLYKVETLNMGKYIIIANLLYLYCHASCNFLNKQKQQTKPSSQNTCPTVCDCGRTTKGGILLLRRNRLTRRILIHVLSSMAIYKVTEIISSEYGFQRSYFYAFQTRY